MMIEIEQATIAHINQLAELFNSYRMFYQKQSDVEAAKKFLSERMEQNESVVFVAKLNHQVIGFVQLYPLFSSTRLRRLWLLNDLFVDELHRGKGASKLLIAAAKKLCIRTNACGMMLETAKNNEVSNQLYTSTGFVLDKELNFYTWASTD